MININQHAKFRDINITFNGAIACAFIQSTFGTHKKGLDNNAQPFDFMGLMQGVESVACETASKFCQFYNKRVFKLSSN